MKKTLDKTIGKSQQEEAAEGKPKNEDNNNDNSAAGVASQQFYQSDDKLAFDDESLDPSCIKISCARAHQSNTILFDKASFENMDKFHKSMQLTIYQCNVCSEAWPLTAKHKNYPVIQPHQHLHLLLQIHVNKHAPTPPLNQH